MTVRVACAGKKPRSKAVKASFKAVYRRLRRDQTMKANAVQRIMTRSYGVARMSLVARLRFYFYVNI